MTASDIDELRAKHTVNHMTGIACHESVPIANPEQLSVGTFRALLDELAELRKAQQWRGIEEAKVNIGDGILAWDESCCGEPYIASLVKRGDVLEWFDGVCFRRPVKFIDLSSFPLPATGADQ